MRHVAGVLRVSIHHSLVEMLSYYPPKVWVVAWSPRVVTQIAFFALLGRFVGGTHYLRFALLGNGFYLLTLLIITTVGASVTWERRAGTLLLLIASPTNPLLIFAGRNVGMATFGFVTGAAGIYLVVPLLGLSMTLSSAAGLVPIVLAVAVGSYGAGLFMGSLALYARGYQNVLSNAFVLLVLVAAGVNYPVATLPASLRLVAWLLPLTRGLQAAHLLFAGAHFSEIANLIGGELGVGIAYALSAQLLIGRLLHRARRDGTLEYY